MTRVAVLISGAGSNMQALARAAAQPGYPADIRLVVSNRSDAPGLALAAAQGIEALAIGHEPYGRNREAHEREIQSALDHHGIELVCLAGYMRLLTPYLVRAWSGRMLNIHPSLLPSFPGLHTHARALEAGVKLHGCTVHQVTQAMDEGPIIAQAAVPVLAGDTASTLADRVLEQEHRLYPIALKVFISGKSGAPSLHAALLNPAGSQPLG